MKKSSRLLSAVLLIMIAASSFSGCSKGNGDISSASAFTGKKRQSALQILTPQASGSVVYGNEIISIDASNTGEGYVMVQYGGSAAKVKLQITIPDGTVYTYTLGGGSYETFPLTGGNGSYHLDILENCPGTTFYALAFSQDIDVNISDEFKPFLYPNQYVWFTEDSQAVKLGREISDKSSDDLSYVQNVYHYVIENIVI